MSQLLGHLREVLAALSLVVLPALAGAQASLGPEALPPTYEPAERDIANIRLQDGFLTLTTLQLDEQIVVGGEIVHVRAKEEFSPRAMPLGETRRHACREARAPAGRLRR